MNDAEFLREGQDYELDLDDPLKDMQEFEKERRKIKESNFIENDDEDNEFF